jgi:hypothetical protein
MIMLSMPLFSSLPNMSTCTLVSAICPSPPAKMPEWCSGSTLRFCSIAVAIGEQHDGGSMSYPAEERVRRNLGSSPSSGRRFPFGLGLFIGVVLSFAH